MMSIKDFSSIGATRKQSIAIVLRAYDVFHLGSL